MVVMPDLRLQAALAIIGGLDTSLLLQLFVGNAVKVDAFLAIKLDFLVAMPLFLLQLLIWFCMLFVLLEFAHLTSNLLFSRSIPILRLD